MAETVGPHSINRCNWRSNKPLDHHPIHTRLIACILLLVLQAVSVIGVHHVIRVAILRALRYSLEYSHKTWIFRISRSSADAISVICAGHYAVGVIPNIHSCANSVMNLAWGTLLRFSHAWCCKCDDPPWPEGELPRWQSISTWKGITHPTHRGLLLNFQQILVCTVFSNTTVVVETSNEPWCDRFYRATSLGKLFIWYTQNCQQQASRASISN